MENKILKTSFINWKDIELFQPSNLKKMSDVQLKKLKTSLKNNGFSTPFYVWEYKDKIYCLDGHHRIPAMKLLEDEGEIIPKKLPANFIDCKNKNDAKKAVLIFNSHYADIIHDNLNNWISDLNLDELNNEIDIEFNLSDNNLKNEEIISYNYIHVLISIPVDKMHLYSELLKNLMDDKNIEYEQSAN